MNEAQNRFMRTALREARRGLRAEEGGPFGAVIVKNDEIIARGHNRVVATHDPTAHAEIVAIRRASRRLERFHLEDCQLYTTCEPCPMCLAAILWAGIPRVYFGCTRDDAAALGFSDREIYEVLSGRASRPGFRLVPLEREACLTAFAEWRALPGRVLY